MIRFLATSLVVLIAATAIWPVIRHPYGWAYRSAANVVLIGLAGHENVRLDACADANPDRDTQVILWDRGREQSRTVCLSSRLGGYMPTALALALAIATPLSWRSRCRLTVVVVAGVQLYILAMILTLPAAYGFSAEASGPVYRAAHSMLSLLYWMVAGSAAGWTIVPVVIWAPLAVMMKARERGADTSSPSKP